MGQPRRAGLGRPLLSQLRPVVRPRSKTTNAKIVDNAGIKRSKIFLMVNTRTQFAISVGDSEPRNFFQKYKTKSTSAQASSPQASSLKHKRTSFPTFRDWRVGGPIIHKLANRGPRVKFDGPWNGGLDKDIAILWMLVMERYLMG